MYIHHTLEEKKEIIRLHESGASMVELMKRFHVRDHYLYILFGRYEKYGADMRNMVCLAWRNTRKESLQMN